METSKRKKANHMGISKHETHDNIDSIDMF